MYNRWEAEGFPTLFFYINLFYNNNFNQYYSKSWSSDESLMNYLPKISVPPNF